MGFSFHIQNLSWFFALLVVSVLLHFLVLKRQQQRVLYFGNVPLLERVIGKKKLFHKNWAALILRNLLVLSIILSLSQPSITFTSNLPAADYILAIDTSPSMAKNLPWIVEGVQNFTKEVPLQTRLGIVTFSGEANVRVTLTDILSEVTNAMSSVNVDLPAGTSLNKALLLSTGLLDQSNKSRVIVLLTDGSREESLDVEANNTLTTLREKNVNVYALGIGDPNPKAPELPDSLKGTENVNIYIPPALDNETLVALANQTNGSFYLVQNETALQESLTDIIKNRKQESTIYLQTHFLILAILFLFLEWGLGATKFSTLP